MQLKETNIRTARVSEIAAEVQHSTNAELMKPIRSGWQK
jgi:hypothetical protein